MTPAVPIVMFGWLPLVMGLFQRMLSRRAVIAALLVGWMFLPQYAYDIPVLPAYSRRSAITWSILLSVVLFDRDRLLAFRLHPLDLPMVLFCFTPLVSSLTNGLGFYDGLSFVLEQFSTWFLFYLIGRLYFGDLVAMRELAMGLVLAAVVLTPFLFFEMLMSPRLHRMIYGFHPHHFGQSRRWGGWRPIVFMEHGLQTAMWMTSATVVAVQLQAVRGLEWLHKCLHAPPLWIVTVLVLTTILCKSMGALLLFLVGAGALWFSRRFKTHLPLIVIMSIPVLYILLRASGAWDAQNLLDFVHQNLPEERAGSLAFRIENENGLIDKALDRRWFGWGGWKRSFVYNERGVAISVPDGFWVLILGKHGVLGIASITVALLLPQLLFVMRTRPVLMATHPDLLLLQALVLVVGLYAIDNLPNDMFNPVAVVIAGGMTSWWVRGDQTAPQSAPEQTKAPTAQEPRLL